MQFPREERHAEGAEPLPPVLFGHLAEFLEMGISGPGADGDFEDHLADVDETCCFVPIGIHVSNWVGRRRGVYSEGDKKRGDVGKDYHLLNLLAIWIGRSAFVAASSRCENQVRKGQSAGMVPSSQ